MMIHAGTECRDAASVCGGEERNPQATSRWSAGAALGSLGGQGQGQEEGRGSQGRREEEEIDAFFLVL